MQNKTEINNREFLVKLLITYFFCLVTGFISYGAEIFNINNYRFNFIVFGLAFSGFYFLLKFYGAYKGILFLLLIFIIKGILLKRFIESPFNILWGHFLWDFLYYCFLGLSTYIFFKLTSSAKYKKNYFYIFSLTILFPLATFLHHILLSLFNPEMGLNFYRLLYLVIPDVLIGFGISIGIYIGRLEPVTKFFHVFSGDSD